VRAHIKQESSIIRGYNSITIRVGTIFHHYSSINCFNNKNSIMTTTSKIVLGVFGALAAGVAIGLLLAPEKGKDTREKIKKTAGGWAESLSQLFTQAEGGIDELKRTVKKQKFSSGEGA
jgi:hypothetical protein